MFCAKEKETELYFTSVVLKIFTLNIYHDNDKKKLY